MAIGKPRGKNGARPVYVHDPRVGRKRYVGSRIKLYGPGGAKELEAQKKLEFAEAVRLGLQEPQGEIKTCREYSGRWFKVKHGPGTARPASKTEEGNRSSLKPFLQKFGERPIDGGIGRREALDWALKHPTQVRAVAAMFNDAIDDEIASSNPFANRRQKRPKGRADIEPITEQEIELLCEIAHERWKGYGLTCAAWILFAAWVGARPGEIANVEWSALDFENGEVTIRRVKPPYNEDTVVLPDRAAEAVRSMGRRHDRIVFTTIDNKKLSQNSFSYYWEPVRSAFVAKLPEERKAELLGDRPNLDLYELRHFCGSIMADRGANEDDISAQLGNTPAVCRRYYIHSYKDRVRERNREALNKVASLDEHRKKRSVG